MSTVLPKSDLNAFLDGDQPDDGEVEEEAVELLELEAAIEEGVADKPAVPLEQCTSDIDTKFSYRRRLAVLAFDIGDQRETADFPHIDRQYPDLLNDFIDQDRFIVTTAIHLRLLNDMDTKHGAWVVPNKQQVMQLADELGVQFIVAGVIEDMSVVDPNVNAVRLMMDSAVRKKVMGNLIRNLVVSLSVYDGGTGALIKRKTFADDTYIDARQLKKRKSLSKAFLRSRYGALITKMLQQQGEFFLSALDCMPIQAKVVAVDEQGVMFDAGIANMILPGDELQLFRRVRNRWQGGVVGGYRLEHHGALTVSQSNPLSAHGDFKQKGMSGGVNPGDIVQAW